MNIVHMNLAEFVRIKEHLIFTSDKPHRWAAGFTVRAAREVLVYEKTETQALHTYKSVEPDALHTCLMYFREEHALNGKPLRKGYKSFAERSVCESILNSPALCEVARQLLTDYSTLATAAHIFSERLRALETDEGVKHTATHLREALKRLNRGE